VRRASCAECLEIWEPQRPGILRVCPHLYGDCFSFNLISKKTREETGLKCVAVLYDF
jgi:hypothetical protein